MNDDLWYVKSEIARERIEDLRAEGMAPLQRALYYGTAFLNESEFLDVEKAWRALDPNGTEADVVQELRKLRVKEEAERRLAGENYEGSKVLSWDDLRAAQVHWIIDGMLAEGSTNYLLARNNLGKTFTLVDALCRMSTGMPFLGRATRPARTVFVLGEGKSGFIDRIDAWLEEHDKTQADLEPWLTFIDGANLSNDACIDLIRSEMIRFDAELLVLDTWAATSGASEENNNALQADLVQRARSIHKDATLMITHHPRKGEEDSDAPVMRGAGALAGGADSIWAMYQDRNYRDKDGAQVDWIALSTDPGHGGKSRNAPHHTFTGLYLKEVGNSAVLSESAGSSISRDASKVKKVLTCTMTVKEYMDAAKVSDKTARKQLAQAVVEGVALYTEGAGTRAGTWTPTAKPEPVAQGSIDWKQILPGGRP